MGTVFVAVLGWTLAGFQFGIKHFLLPKFVQVGTVAIVYVVHFYTRSRLYGHRIYGLFGYMVNFWVVPISLSTIRLTIYPEFDLNFGYMVNF